MQFRSGRGGGVRSLPRARRPPGIRIRRNTRFQNRCASASKLANGRLSYSRAAGVMDEHALGLEMPDAAPRPSCQTMTPSARHSNSRAVMRVSDRSFDASGRRATQIHARAVRNLRRQLPESGIQFRRRKRPRETSSCHGFQGYPRRLETKHLMDTHIILLPGQRLSPRGRPRLDYAAVAGLAFPFMLNSAVQAVLNATDTWFIGRLSPTATAAIGAVYWPVLVFVLLFGGVGLSVQTLVAQAYGAGRHARASQATWTAIWASIFTLPVFGALAAAGAWLFAPFGIARGHTAARAGILVTPHAGRAAGHRPVVDPGILQRRGPAHGHVAGHGGRRRGQRPSQSAFRHRARMGYRRIGLGDGRGAAVGRRARADGLPEQTHPRALPLPFDHATAAAGPWSARSSWDFRWACSPPRTSWDSPCFN